MENKKRRGLADPSWAPFVGDQLLRSLSVRDDVRAGESGLAESMGGQINYVDISGFGALPGQFADEYAAGRFFALARKTCGPALSSSVADRTSAAENWS